MKSKKAVFFSIDALIALIIILMILIIAIPTIKQPQTQTKVHSDTMQVLSNLKIGEIDNAQIQALIASGDIENTDKSILEQIGEFYVTDKPLARQVSNEILSYIETEKNIGIWYANELIASKNSTPITTATNIEVERQTISGLQAGNDTTGFAARVYLSSDAQTKYFFFGGYIGDGNISSKIDYTGNITDAKVEIATNKDFDIYINGIYSGHYENSTSDIVPVKYNLNSYLANFQSGSSIIEFTGDNIHIAGGYIKITYDGFPENETIKYQFPGITGLINLYDSFYTNNLASLNIFLHLNTPYDVFLSIGNQTVFENSTTGEETITITDAELSSILNYNQLINKTMPIRFGLRNASYLTNVTLNTDAFSVTDLSGSMQDECTGGGFFCCWFQQDCSTQAGCSACGGTYTSKITAAKQANDAFIEGILNYSGNEIGLAGYETNADNSDYHELSDDETSLKTQVSSWDADGMTCICCGINRAIAGFTGSPAEKLKTMVVMSDGEANYACDGFNDYTGSDRTNAEARQDAIDSACEAYQNHDITVHAVAFGTDADEDTLQQIATCGNGTYYSGSIEEIIELYEEISQDIIEASYSEQTISATEGFQTTTLYPDSYIEIGQTSTPTTITGLVLTIEDQFDNTSAGTFTIPQDSTAISAKAISYSGPRWTDSVSANENNIFQLNEYGNNYIELGDPYIITIPKQLLQENNTIEISTGLSPANSSEGSEHNKIIYQIQKNSSSYSSISPYLSGCIWHIEFEDETNATISVPANYTDGVECYYTSSTQNYDNNDALQEAVYRLLRILDLNLNNKVETKLSENNLEITPNQIEGIPFTWSTEVQIRIWS
jgi:hypothetical protein